jgi:Ca-activated chloride channel homolog
MRRFWLCAFVAVSGVLAQEPVFRVESSVVEVQASIFDKRGNPLPNIPQERFRVTDAGQKQALLSFESAADRLSVALLLDITGSMDNFLPALKLSVLRFVDLLREDDEVAVYTFNAGLQARQPFTSDKKAIKQAILRTTAGGRTALFDSMSKVSRDLAARKGKRVLVVFTDGEDNASSLSAASATNQARRAGVPIYLIAQGAALTEPKLLKVLEETAQETGGIPFRLRKPNEIGEVFGEINRNLQHTYLLSWKLPDDAGAGWHPIAISVEGVDGARIRARQGYWPR